MVPAGGEVVFERNTRSFTALRFFQDDSVGYDVNFGDKTLGGACQGERSGCVFGGGGEQSSEMRFERWS